ncbi:hypothetical protein BJ508DRAFT_310662 [Ascobolus immersus RN42]|uniref:Uncharacterized protein n=1 Tax=Ascobolus immersus RN42 TaxID=1160509 RepID=A0A3N4I4Y1_ASCIM|nr:hypothetical protein BJ508DRAFT_310662 [Ascobolus immersus RN42]
MLGLSGSRVPKPAFFTFFLQALRISQKAIVHEYHHLSNRRPEHRKPPYEVHLHHAFRCTKKVLARVPLISPISGKGMQLVPSAIHQVSYTLQWKREACSRVPPIFPISTSQRQPCCRTKPNFSHALLHINEFSPYEYQLMPPLDDSKTSEPAEYEYESQGINCQNIIFCSSQLRTSTDPALPFTFLREGRLRRRANEPLSAQFPPRTPCGTESLHTRFPPHEPQNVILGSRNGPTSLVSSTKHPPRIPIGRQTFSRVILNPARSSRVLSHQRKKVYVPKSVPKVST